MKDLLVLHDDLVDFGSEVQCVSNQLYKERKHINLLFFDLGTKIGSYLVTLHRANRTLVEAGWAHTTPLLLRGMLESTVNYLTVMNSSEPEYMAFRFFTHDYFRVLVDQEAESALQVKARADIDYCLSLINDPGARKKAEERIASVLRTGNVETFWFSPDRVTDCILRVADPEVKKDLLSVYKYLSMSIHGSHMGMVMFKDNANDFDINPSDNPQRGAGALLISIKLLIEFLVSRCTIEKLGLESDYNKLLERAQTLYEAYRIGR
jgi:hypothetical protein